MDFYGAACVICFIHGSLYFIDFFLKSCSHYPYLYFLENTGFKIDIFRVQWYTTVFNRYFQKSVRCQPKLLRRWFSLGVWITLILIPLAMFLVVSTAVNNMIKSEQSGSAATKLVLEPMIPGVNLPLNDMSYYIIAIAICSVFHEAGHALAAVREGVQVSGFGVCIFVILPSAYVLLNSSQLEALPPYRSLRILTAGVWHNVVLAVVATLAVLSAPYALKPLFSLGEGLYTVEIPETSPFRGPTGLNPGDMITKVNGDCDVSNQEDWKNCILVAISKLGTTSGFCVSNSFLLEGNSISNSDLPVNISPDCCSTYDGAGYLCFGSNLSNATKREETQRDNKFQSKNYCLPARKVVEESGIPCKTHLTCPNDHPICIQPYLNNETQLFVIGRVGSNKLLPKDVIFLGHPSEAWWGIKVSDYVPNFSFLPYIFAVFPEVIVHQLKYLAVLSSGLALINVLPFFVFDGQHIITAVLRHLLSSFVSARVSDKIAKYVIIMGSLSLGMCILSALVEF